MTVLVLLLVDLLHSSSVIYDVYAMTQQLETLNHTIRVNEDVASPVECVSVVDRAVALISRNNVVHIPLMYGHDSTSYYCLSKCNRNPCCFKKFAWSIVNSRISPSIQPKRADITTAANTIAPFQANLEESIVVDTPSVKGGVIVRKASCNTHTTAAAQTEYVATTLRLLHLTEFSILEELIEVIVPIIYSTLHATAVLPLLGNYMVLTTILKCSAVSYATVMVFLPNRAFCVQLSSVNVDNIGSMVLRMLSYAMVEFISLIVLDWILRKHLNFSPVAQLSMVLEFRWASVQAGIMLCIVYTVQGLLEHFGRSILLLRIILALIWSFNAGSDFSFQFAWLHRSLTDSGDT